MSSHKKRKREGSPSTETEQADWINNEPAVLILIEQFVLRWRLLTNKKAPLKPKDWDEIREVVQLLFSGVLTKKQMIKKLGELKRDYEEAAWRAAMECFDEHIYHTFRTIICKDIKQRTRKSNSCQLNGKEVPISPANMEYRSILAVNDTKHYSASQDWVPTDMGSMTIQGSVDSSVTQDLARPSGEGNSVPNPFLPSGSGYMDTYTTDNAQFQMAIPVGYSAMSPNLPMNSLSTSHRISGLSQPTDNPSLNRHELASNFTPFTGSHTAYPSFMDADSPYPPQYQPPTSHQFQFPFSSQIGTSFTSRNPVETTIQYRPPPVSGEFRAHSQSGYPVQYDAVASHNSSHGSSWPKADDGGTDQG